MYLLIPVCMCMCMYAADVDLLFDDGVEYTAPITAVKKRVSNGYNNCHGNSNVCVGPKRGGGGGRETNSVCCMFHEKHTK